MKQIKFSDSILFHRESAGSELKELHNFVSRQKQE